MRRIRVRFQLRLWQKMFLALFTTTAVLFNCAMFTVVNLNYNQQMQREKDRAAAEQIFVSTNLYKDMVELEENDNLKLDIISQNYEVYRKFYEKQGINLELWHQDTLYGENLTGLEKREELDLSTGVQNLIVRHIKGERYLFVASQLSSPYEEYSLVLSYSLKDIITLRTQMIQITLAIDIALLLVVMIVIFLIIRQMMKPLELLSEATTEIAAGDYEKKIRLKGKDEFVTLADQFNKMSTSISEKVTQLEQENESRQRLIDNMAHELRTPLTAIQGYAEYAKLAKIDEGEKLEVLDYIIGQVKRIEKLSNTLLQLASIREEAPELMEVSIPTLVEELRHSFFEREQAAQVTVDYQVQVQELECNKELILLLLGNLIENAIRACEPNGNVEVSFLPQENGSKLVVSDNGIGMEASQLEKIRQPFYRVDKARSRKNGGVGLGVTLCYQIARYHNATLEYESTIGYGTKAIVSFEKEGQIQ